ncbi:hypothethical protein (plasmid) [Ralstonia solanacearum CMR15]|nr:hypothethical protein [Ralstonia solanacearum CMR15]
MQIGSQGDCDRFAARRRRLGAPFAPVIRGKGIARLVDSAESCEQLPSMHRGRLFTAWVTDGFGGLIFQ